jgi:hypothetical protein
MQRIRSLNENVFSEFNGREAPHSKLLQFVAYVTAQVHNTVGGGNCEDLRQHSKNDCLHTQDGIGGRQAAGEAAESHGVQLCGLGFGGGLRFAAVQHFTKSADQKTYRIVKFPLDRLCDIVDNSLFFVSPLRHRGYTKPSRCFFNLNGRVMSRTKQKERETMKERIITCWYGFLAVVIGIIAIPQLMRDQIETMEAEEAAERGQT